MSYDPLTVVQVLILRTIAWETAMFTEGYRREKDIREQLEQWQDIIKTHV
jgi:hypothetical protein